MSLFASPEEHAANPPETWKIVKAADRCWRLCPSDGDYPLDTFTTRHAAEQAKTSGWLVNLYAKEGRWYAGEPVTGWRTYSDCLASRKPLR